MRRPSLTCTCSLGRHIGLLTAAKFVIRLTRGSAITCSVDIFPAVRIFWQDRKSLRLISHWLIPLTSLASDNTLLAMCEGLQVSRMPTFVCLQLITCLSIMSKANMFTELDLTINYGTLNIQKPNWTTATCTHIHVHVPVLCTFRCNGACSAFTCTWQIYGVVDSFVTT